MINSFLKDIDNPHVLEIGIEHGTITFQLLTELIKSPRFLYHGVDIDIKDHVRLFGKNLESNEHVITFKEQNSLTEMPKLIEAGLKFDAILIDGDHNYYTVSKELEYAKKLMHDNTIIIVDDYHGPWATRDYWYGSDARSTQHDNKLATPKRDSYVHGIHVAVHSWLRMERDLEIYSLSELNILRPHRPNFLLRYNKERYYHAVLIKKKGFNDGLLAT